MGPFGSRRDGFNGGSFGIYAVMLAQLAGLYVSSSWAELWFILEVTSQVFYNEAGG
jgi:hypothetical protein